VETVTAVNDRILALALMAAVAGCSISRTPGTTMPTTPRRPVTDEYHGVRVVDDYRWLEHGDDPEVRRWTEQQNRFTSATLDTIAARPQILQRLQAISRSTSATYSGLAYRDGALFALKALPPARHPYLVRMTGPDDLTSERVVVDPNTLDSSGSTTIDFYVPSPDGRLVALSLSRSGTENGTLHVYETATGRALNDTIAHINDATAAGSVAWNEAATVCPTSMLRDTTVPSTGARMAVWSKLSWACASTAVSCSTTAAAWASWVCATLTSSLADSAAASAASTAACAAFTLATA